MRSKLGLLSAALVSLAQTTGGGGVVEVATSTTPDLDATTEATRSLRRLLEI